MMAGKAKYWIIVAGCISSLCTTAHADNVWGPSPNQITRQIDRSSETRGWHGPSHGRSYEHHRENYRNNGGYYAHARHRSRDIVGGDGLPSYVEGVGTFAGGLSAVRFRGNGIYFYADNLSANAANNHRPRAKIIDVSPSSIGNTKSACSMEHGVCVVRGAP